MRGQSLVVPSGTTIDSPTFTGAVSGGGRVLAQSFAGISTPADTTEDALVTVTIPANIMGANGALIVTTRWLSTGAATARTARVRFSGASGTIYMSVANSTNVYFTQVTTIANTGATNSQAGDSYGGASGNAFQGSNAGVTSAVDTTASTTVVITGQKVTAGDVLTLVGYTVELLRP